jgi:hypothetical protein
VEGSLDVKKSGMLVAVSNGKKFQWVDAHENLASLESIEDEPVNPLPIAAEWNHDEVCWKKAVFAVFCLPIHGA